MEPSQQPWKNHEKQNWLEDVLKNLYKKLVTTIDEINKTDETSSEKVKVGKDISKKTKVSSFPVPGRKKSKIKSSLVKAVYVETGRQGETETETPPPKKELPEAKRFWSHVDTCYKLTLKACNVKESKEVVQKKGAKKRMKLPRKKIVKKRTPANRRCFARSRPGFLTSVITDTNFFYPIIIGKRIRNLASVKDVSRHGAHHSSKDNTQMKNVEMAMPKLKLQSDPQSKRKRREEKAPGTPQSEL